MEYAMKVARIGRQKKELEEVIKWREIIQNKNILSKVHPTSTKRITNAASINSLEISLLEAWLLRKNSSRFSLERSIDSIASFESFFRSRITGPDSKVQMLKLLFKNDLSFLSCSTLKW